jgi:DNA topoisomerase-1
LEATDDPFTIEEARAIELIQAKRLADAGDALGEFEGSAVTTGKGRFGPYVKHEGKYFSLAKTDSLTTITLERAIEIIQAKRNQEANKYIKEFPENETIKVVNGVYGPYIKLENVT